MCVCMRYGFLLKVFWTEIEEEWLFCVLSFVFLRIAKAFFVSMPVIFLTQFLFLKGQQRE